MSDDLGNLQSQIEKLRHCLALLVTDKGLNHNETILASQRLDVLLNQYNQQRFKESFIKGYGY